MFKKKDKIIDLMLLMLWKFLFVRGVFVIEFRFFMVINRVRFGYKNKV